MKYYGKITTNNDLVTKKYVETGFETKANLVNGLIPDTEIPNLTTSKITSGTFSDERIASANNWNGKSTVTVSNTGTATDEVKYITIDGVEKKIVTDSKVFYYTVPIPNSDWNENASTGWYTKQITVNGITENDIPDVDINLSNTTSITDVEDAIETWSNIFRIVTNNGSITVYSSQIPLVEFTITLRCIR